MKETRPAFLPREESRRLVQGGREGLGKITLEQGG